MIQIAKDSRPVNDKIAELLNMEYNAFKRSVFSGQKELAELSETTGEARKKMIRRMVGLEQLDEIQTTINGDVKSFRNQIIGQTQNLLTQENLSEYKEKEFEVTKEHDVKLKEKETILADLRNKEKDYIRAKDNFEKEEAKFNKHIELQNSITKQSTRIEEFNNSLTLTKEKKQKIEILKQECKTVENQILNFEKEKNELNQMQTIYDRILRRNHYSTQQKTWKENLPIHERKIKELTKESAQGSLLKEEFNKNKESMECAKKQKDTLLNNKQTTLNEISSLKGKINDRNEKVNNIERIGRSGQCPTCFQSIHKVYDATIQNMKKEIDEFQNLIIKNHQSILSKTETQLKETEQKIQSLDNVRLSLTRQISTIEQIEKQIKEETENRTACIKKIDELQNTIDSFGELNLDHNRFEELKEKVKNFENQYIEFKKKENYVATELPLTERQITNIENNIKETYASIGNLKKTVLALGFSVEFYETAKANKTIEENLLNKIKEILHRKELEIKDISTKLSQIKQVIQNHYNIIKQIEDKINEIELLEKLSSLIGEFKTNILEKISPSISEEASKLFNRITKGKYENIKVDESFDFHILDNSQYYPINRFSGGEIDLANFCLRIAITKAIADLSGAKNTLNFLAFDEIFGSQDEDRKTEILSALNFLQEQFKQIYIISHDETVKEFFPNILEITQGSDGSETKWI
jgi:exonuclease SbcC